MQIGNLEPGKQYYVSTTAIIRRDQKDDYSGKNYNYHKSARDIINFFVSKYKVKHFPGFSNEVIGETAPIPAKLVQLGNATEKALTVTWENVPSAVFYEIELKEESEGFSEVLETYSVAIDEDQSTNFLNIEPTVLYSREFSCVIVAISTSGQSLI